MVDRRGVVRQDGYGYSFVKSLECLIHWTNNSLVEILYCLYLQFQIAVVSGFIARLDMYIDEIFSIP